MPLSGKIGCLVGWHPPAGNPGSATGLSVTCSIMQSHQTFHKHKVVWNQIKMPLYGVSFVRIVRLSECDLNLRYRIPLHKRTSLCVCRRIIWLDSERRLPWSTLHWLCTKNECQKVPLYPKLTQVSPPPPKWKLADLELSVKLARFQSATLTPPPPPPPSKWKVGRFGSFKSSWTLDQGCHVSGKCQGKTKFSPGQGKVREFWKNVREFFQFHPCQGIVREFCDVMSGNCQGMLSWHYF